jgi:hypothetical protein
MTSPRRRHSDLHDPTRDGGVDDRRSQRDVRPVRRIPGTPHELLHGVGERVERETLPQPCGQRLDALALLTITVDVRIHGGEEAPGLGGHRLRARRGRGRRRRLGHPIRRSGLALGLVDRDLLYGSRVAPRLLVRLDRRLGPRRLERQEGVGIVDRMPEARGIDRLLDWRRRRDRGEHLRRREDLGLERARIGRSRRGQDHGLGDQSEIVFNRRGDDGGRGRRRGRRWSRGEESVDRASEPAEARPLRRISHGP